MSATVVTPRDAIGFHGRQHNMISVGSDSATAGRFLQSPAKFVEQVTAANDVVVFTTSYGCDSIRAKAFFEQEQYRDLDVKCYDLDTLPFGKALLSILPQIPTIYIKQKLLGTLSDLELALQRGEFSGILEAAQ